MKWFKNLFIAPEWETIFTGKCLMSKTNLFSSTKSTGFLKVEIDKKRNKYRCYLTDGIDEKDFDLIVATNHFPELIPILKQNDVIY